MQSNGGRRKYNIRDRLRLRVLHPMIGGGFSNHGDVEEVSARNCIAHLDYKRCDAIVWSRPHIEPTLVQLSIFIRPLTNDPRAWYNLKEYSALCQVYPAVRQIFPKEVPARYLNALERLGAVA